MIFQSPAPQPLLDKIVANIAELHHSLPSLTTQEDILSDLSQHGLYRAHAKAVASLRVFAGAPGEQLNEARTYLSVNGKPVAPGRKNLIPFELNGAFSRVPETYFTPAHLQCYVFTQLPQPASDGSTQLTFASNPDLPETCANKGISLTGLVRVDLATGQLHHLERTIVTPPTPGQHTTTFISIDFASASIGDQRFWLPSLLTATMDKGYGHFTAHYSNFHRYTGSLTILPDVTRPGAEQEP